MVGLADCEISLGPFPSGRAFAHTRRWPSRMAAFLICKEESAPCGQDEGSSTGLEPVPFQDGARSLAGLPAREDALLLFTR